MSPSLDGMIARFMERDYLERLIAALEKIADKPPVVVATPRPQEPISKQLATTPDGIRFRHPLESGGWLIEVVNPDGPPILMYDGGDGIRHLLHW